MYVNKILNDNEYRATALAYSKILSDGINSYAAALAKGYRYKFIAWLEDKTVEYNASQKQVVVYPCIVVVDYTLILIGGNLRSTLNPITISNVTEDTFKVYVTFDQTYSTNQSPPTIVITTDTQNGVLLATVENGQVKPVLPDERYYLKLQNLPLDDYAWTPKSQWTEAGTIAVSHDSDAYIAFCNVGSPKLHLVVDGDIYVNEGQKQVAYSDLSNVENAVLQTTIDLTKSKLKWYQDTDYAYLEMKSYGSNESWLTLTFGDDPNQDRVVFHWKGTDGEYDVGYLHNGGLVIHKNLSASSVYVSQTLTTQSLQATSTTTSDLHVSQSLQASSITTSSLHVTQSTTIDQSLTVGSGSTQNVLNVPRIILDAPQSGWDQRFESKGIIRLKPDTDKSGDPYVNLLDYNNNVTISMNAETGSISVKGLDVRGDGGIEIYSENDDICYIDFHKQSDANRDYSGRILYNGDTKIFALMSADGGCRLSVDNYIIGRETISTNDPSGGLDGDKWFKV